MVGIEKNTVSQYFNLREQAFWFALNSANE